MVMAKKHKLNKATCFLDLQERLEKFKSFSLPPLDPLPHKVLSSVSETEGIPLQKSPGQFVTKFSLNITTCYGKNYQS